MNEELYPWETPDPESDLVPMERGRRALPFTQLAEWIGLADITAQAARLYWIYSMHVNQARGDRKTWPTRRTVATMLGLKKVSGVDRYNKELQTLGAIDIRKNWKGPKERGPNIVVVHETPPDGYSGPMSLADLYKRARTARRTSPPSIVEKEEKPSSQGDPGKGTTPSPEKRARSSPENGAVTIRRELDEEQTI